MVGLPGIDPGTPDTPSDVSIHLALGTTLVLIKLDGQNQIRDNELTCGRIVGNMPLVFGGRADLLTLLNTGEAVGVPFTAAVDKLDALPSVTVVGELLTVGFTWPRGHLKVTHVYREKSSSLI